MRSGRFPMKRFSLLLLAIVTLTLGTWMFTGCAGYRVGSIAGAELQGVRSIWVPPVRNKSLEPALPGLATNAIRRRIDNDGTLENTSDAQADAVLEVTITRIERDPVRNARNDVLLAAQYDVKIHAVATLTNRRLGRKIFENRPVSGRTHYYLQADSQEVERQAMPLATEDLAQHVVSMVTEGW